MAEVWKSKGLDTCRQWLETILLESEEKLNDWERTFLGSIEDKLDMGRVLTRAQEEKLEQIYAEKTS